MFWAKWEVNEQGALMYSTERCLVYNPAQRHYRFVCRHIDFQYYIWKLLSDLKPVTDPFILQSDKTANIFCAFASLLLQSRNKVESSARFAFISDSVVRKRPQAEHSILGFEYVNAMTLSDLLKNSCFVPTERKRKMSWIPYQTKWLKQSQLCYNNKWLLQCSLQSTNGSRSLLSEKVRYVSLHSRWIIWDPSALRTLYKWYLARIHH